MINKERDKKFDYIIDVRTPQEYEYSHIPHAINLAVFDNQEYAQIGTLYKDSPLKAKILGASIACKNIAKMLENIPEDKSLHAILNHKNKLLIYCARGGKRSQSMQIIFQHIGFHTQKLENGYKGYRNEVLSYFSSPLKHSFIALCGPTGCGKSEIIQSLNPCSIDLESLAKHYGSSFGGMATFKIGKQPTQKMFENMLFEELRQKINQPILFIEAESQKLGSITIPKTLMNAYHNQANILIEADITSRIERILKLYKNIPESEFLWAMGKIKPYLTKNLFDEILILWNHQDLYKIAEILIVKYYDKVYKKTKYFHKIYNKNLQDTLGEILEIKKNYEKSFKPL
ncbi:tRNA 2-selenouridine(34) synthase MnmH [Helicobacter sp. 11S03491-1]|nr:tRNA 2-selenouridine(34) synthase MnmH [Helicobacter sp. 11S03491-1]